MSEQKYTATLVRGESWFLRDLHFPKGVAIVISAEQKAYLEEQAVDNVPGEIDEETGEMDVQYKAKFEYAEYEGDLELGSIASSTPAGKARKIIPATTTRKRTKAEAA